jgi:PKD repeat protein
LDLDCSWGADVTTRIFALAAVMAITGCALDNQGAPSLTGPSELGLSLEITATPDVITQDGASQAVIRITARDANSQPIAGLAIRLDLAVGTLPVDFGTLSTKTLSTGADGRATVIYTAPPPPPASASGDVVVSIVFTPVGANYSNSQGRTVLIRLARPGVVLPPNGTPIPRFIASPTTARVGDKVFFDGTTSVDLDGTIVDYFWNFGDGDTASGPTVEHSYDLAGTYRVTLTVTDDRGLKATSAPQEIAIGAIDLPVAAFTASPESATLGTTIHFNGLLSTAAPEHEIVSYEWHFGDGHSAVGPTVSHDYAAAGTYTVVLKVTDNFGLSAVTSKSVTIMP